VPFLFFSTASTTFYAPIPPFFALRSAFANTAEFHESSLISSDDDALYYLSCNSAQLENRDPLLQAIT